MNTEEYVNILNRAEAAGYRPHPTEDTIWLTPDGDKIAEDDLIELFQHETQ